MSFKSHALTFVFAVAVGSGATIFAADQYIHQKTVVENNPCEVYQNVDKWMNRHYEKVQGEGSGSSYKETEILGMKGCVLAGGSKSAPKK